MSRYEEFADPTVVPGPNVRSLFTDTEQVEDAVTEQPDEDASRWCPVCHRVLPGTTLVCTVDGTALVELPAT